MKTARLLRVDVDTSATPPWVTAPGIPAPVREVVSDVSSSQWQADLFGNVRQLRPSTATPQGGAPDVYSMPYEVSSPVYHVPHHFVSALGALHEIQYFHCDSHLWNVGGNAGLHFVDHRNSYRPACAALENSYQRGEPFFTWLEIDHGSTWSSLTAAAAKSDISKSLVTSGIASAIAAGLNENFESGYVSNFRKNLSGLFARHGFETVEALCNALRGLARPASSLLREAFLFLGSLKDEESKDFRIVFLASFLSDSSPVNRDSAALALADLGDRRGADYLRSAAETESHPRLKFDFLEIAAELSS